MTFVVCPNLAVDRVLRVAALRPGELMRCRALRQQAGGKGSNVLRALRTLGATAGVLAGLAAGHGGRLVAELAAEEGLDVESVVAGGEARVSTVVLEDDGSVTRIFEFGPEIGAQDESALLRVVGSRPAAPGEWAIVDGAAPPGASAGFYRALCRALRANGYRVMVDATGEQLAGALTMRPDFVKVNLSEARSVAGPYTGEPALGDGLAVDGELATGDTLVTEALGLCRRLVAAGAGGALVTLGSAGAAGLIDGVEWRLHPPSVKAVNPVGSGDCFAAALLLGFERGDPVEATLAAATGAAAANVASPITGHFDLDLAGELADRASISRAGP